MLRASICITALLASACTDPALSFRQNTVDSVIEAGETHVAVVSVAPWKDIATHIQPNFNIDEKKALQEAIPRLSAFEEKLLNIFAAKLEFAPPQTSTTTTRTTDLVTGEVTGTRTEEEKPGAAPGSEADADGSAIEEADKAAAKIKDEDRKEVATTDDPFLRYQTANSIFQYVKLLDRLVQNVPQIQDYTPYLVTFQITSFPYARHQPYDVYLDMSFFPHVEGGVGTLGGQALTGLRTPIVVPVLITDNLQAQTVSRSAELISQLDAAAQALSGGFFASLGLSNNNRRSGAVFGTDYTSTFTVGRSAENGLTAVLGAALNPYSEFAMIRRTHNVSTLIFVPNETATALQQEPGANGILGRRIGVTMTTSLRRPDQPGVVLDPVANSNRQGSPARLAKRLKELGMAHQFNTDNCSIEAAAGLIGYVPISSYGGYLQELRRKCPNFPFPEALYHVLSDIYGSSAGFRSTTIHLPRV